MAIVKCIVYTMCFAMAFVKCTVYTMHFVMAIVKCTVYIAQTDQVKEHLNIKMHIKCIYYNLNFNN
jgi:hypothetical protein